MLLPALREANGDIAVTMVLAHEYGHADPEDGKNEQEGHPDTGHGAAGRLPHRVYMRWVAEDNSSRFTLSTGDGLDNLLAAMISFRDPLMSEFEYSGEQEHGSAFERISAFQFGFTDGASACTSIDLREIGQRRGDLPVMLPEDQTGEWPVSEESVRAIVDAMGILFSPANPPQLSFDASSASDCPDARPSPPASYCPASNTIVVDLPELEVMGAQSDDADGGGVLSGDNTAYSVLVSRYMQAIQHERGGLVLDNAEAALRTACLTGVATTKMSKAVSTLDGNTIALTAGDVDEAGRASSPTAWSPAMSTASPCRPDSPGSTPSASACSATKTAASSGSVTRPSSSRRSTPGSRPRHPSTWSRTRKNE